MPFKVSVQPVGEPLPITDPIVKQSMRVIDTAEDGFIGMLLTQAREACELLTWRTLITTQYVMAMDKFPSPGMNTSSANWYGPSWGTGPGPLTVSRPDGVTQSEIYCPRPPLQSVQSIRYIDQTGAQQTLDPSAYIVDTMSEPGRIMPAPNSSWPATNSQPNAVEVRFTAGYGDTGAAVPAGLKHWILLMVSTMYENREMVAIMNRGTIQELPYVSGLLDVYGARTYDVPAYW